MISKVCATNADYMLIFDSLLRPIASQFSPQLTIFAAGFDSCGGDPLASGGGERAAGKRDIFRVNCV